MELLELEAAVLRLHQARKPALPVSKLVVEDTEVVATSPEGATVRMPVEALLAKVAAGQLSTGDLILPDGVKTVISQGAITIMVWESPPRLHQFDWIANDSPAGYGQGTTYRKVRLALPYVIMVAVFARNEAGLPQLLSKNECFFRNAPLKRLDDELLYPALLNCSKFTPQEGRPLSWICTQHLRPTPTMQSADPAERFRGGLDTLRHCLLETAFNLSSDHHEGASWFSLSRGIDPRLSSVEAWQEASAQNPLFVLEIPWLQTNHTVRQLVDRIFANLQVHRTRITNAAGLARIIFNHH
jgi:hypothetical protein